MKKYFLFLIYFSIITFVIVSNMNSVDYHYYSSGKISAEYIKNRISGNLQVIYYYENGNIMEELTYSCRWYYTLKCDYLIHGSRYLYYSTGDLKKEMIYENGQLHGQEIKYHTNGEVFHVMNWEKDSIIGDVEFYYEDGKFRGINKNINNRPYYAKIYPRSNHPPKDYIIPHIYLHGRGNHGDTIVCEIEIHTDDTPYSIEDFSLNYNSVGADSGIELTQLPYPATQYNFVEGKRKIIRYIVESKSDENYFYGFLDHCDSSLQNYITRDFYIKIPKDSFSISYPSNDTTYIKSIKM